MASESLISNVTAAIFVAAVGAGKTIIASAVIQARLPEGPALFLAHRDELLDQAIDKLRRATGIVAAREQATNHASLSDSVVVASVSDAARSQAGALAPRSLQDHHCG
jgi:superfamily II DNA or RNA helicase